MRVPFCCAMLVLSALGMAVGQDTNFATGPQYLMTQASPLFARPISTPSYSLNSPPLEIGASTATSGLVAGTENRTVSPLSPGALPTVNLFPIYYGEPTSSVIEVSFPQEGESSAAMNLPASILDTGVWQLSTAQALRARGYGVTLGEAAQYGKMHTRHAPRVYSNADIDRLRGEASEHAN